jgi:hypothetical protein
MDQDDDPALAETHSPALGERPVADSRTRAVARAKIANALFATDQRVKLGRYHLLERVGEGGMGVVWGAFDPELERRVAIKLVRAKSGASRERILLEGQALAKLSHPNVVAVHDVGVVDDEVYLVMEWIRGHNLREHCRQSRSAREIVALFRAAGEGLLAAHRAGLVHRDFKPENVMIGDDGRVRVVDFGLALDLADEDDHAVAGTPKYMAPEQQRGEAVTEAADQFAFGLALGEALTARNADRRDAPVSAWLTAIVARATAAVPAERFASLDTLLRALARDPARVWRRRVVVASALVAVAGAFAIGSLSTNDGPAPCSGGRDDLATAWNPVKREHMLGHARELGPYGAAEASAIDTRLAAYGERWVAAHRNACLAHRRGELTPRLYERNLACLARARVALETVVDVVTRAPIERFPEAVLASRGLPDVDRCTLDEPAVVPPIPALASHVDEASNRVARASMLALAGDPQAGTVAAAAVTDAERLRYAPLVARAHLAHGRALVLDPSKLPAALEAFEHSAAAALAAGDDVTFVESFARELFVYARTPKDLIPANATGLPSALRYVQQIAKRTGDVGRFARALLYNNAGTERLTAGDAGEARRWYREAYDETQAGARDIELWSVLGNLAATVESADERDRLFAKLREHLEHELGANHAFTLQERFRAAMFTEHGTRVASQLRELCAAFRTWYPHRKDKIDQCYYELGWLAEERGDRAEARDAMAAVGGSKDERVPLARAFAMLYAGDATAAARTAADLATQAAQRKAWWEQFHAVDAWLIEATARTALGDRVKARQSLERALALLDQPGFNRTATFHQRRVARVRALLAMQTEPSRGSELAAQALAWYRKAGGYDGNVAALDAIVRAGSR